MAGPWEKYQSQDAAGPWEKYNVPPTQTSLIMDLGSSIIRGLAKGGMQTGTMAASTKEQVEPLQETVREAAGVSPETGKSLKGIGDTILKYALPQFSGPTASQVQQGVEKVTGKFGKPQSEAGAALESIGEFAAPSALGKGKLVNKALGAVGGGLGSEKGRQLAEQYLGPWAGPLGGVIGGALGAGTGASVKTRGAQPSVEALDAASDVAYKEAAALPLELAPSGVEKLHKSIVADLKAHQYRDYLSKEVFHAVDELLSPAGKNVTVGDIDGVRKLLARVTSKYPEDKGAANLVRARIDDYLSNIPNEHVVKGDPSPVSDIFRRARGNYAPARRSEEVSDAMYNAELQAKSAGSGANIDNAIRQQFKAILKNDNRRRGFSEDEIKMMERIVEGGPIGNMARKLGKFAPTGVVSATPTILAKLAGGNVPAAAIAGGGYAAKSFSDYLTRKGVKNLDEMIRSRSSLNRGKPLSMADFPSIESKSIDAMIRSALASGADQGND